jgi:hypothetical protein
LVPIEEGKAEKRRFPGIIERHPQERDEGDEEKQLGPFHKSGGTVYTKINRMKT